MSSMKAASSLNRIRTSRITANDMHHDSFLVDDIRKPNEYGGVPFTFRSLAAETIRYIPRKIRSPFFLLGYD